jgi:O-antigen/teichoic acid export membrane protein
VTSALTASSLLVPLLGFVTAPIQARVLGPAGRGELAAIMVPLSLAPTVLSVGLTVYATKEAARGRPTGLLLGSLAVILAPICVVAALGAGSFASQLADGRDVVDVYLRILAYALPLTFVGGLLTAIAVGRERWRLVVYSRLFTPVAWLVGILGLWLSDSLSVTTAAATAFVAGFGSMLPFVPMLLAARPFKVDLATTASGLLYGVRAWLSSLASVVNARLDQFLMITLVSSSQLGFYAVAASLASTSFMVAASLAQAVSPGIAAGDLTVVPRACRTTVVIVLGYSLGLALLCPMVIPLLFGARFHPALGMTWVLLLAGVPLAVSWVLATALNNVDRPSASGVGELLAILVTVPGLLVVLPRWGAQGAAWVSLLAYSASCCFLLLVSKKAFGVPVRALLLPQRRDLVGLRDSLRGLLRTRPV